MTILLFFVVLFILILVHEWGHFIVAKKTGMRVDEFGIGFPPKLFGIKKGETEYTFNALPIGGFVRIYGENALDADKDKGEGGDTSRSFTSKSAWAQSAVLVAGVTMNIIFAWFLFVVVFLMGVPTVVEEFEASDSARLLVTSVLPDSPAEMERLPVGAEIVSYANADTEAPLTPSAFRAYTAESDGSPLTVTYLLDGEEKSVTIIPQTGLIADNPDQPAVGVSLALVDTIRTPFFEALKEGTIRTYESLIAITVGLASLFVDIAQNDADLSQVAGPVGIVGLVGDAAQFGFASLLLFTAVISLNLAVINLLPFPALDGGRLVMVFIEAVIKRPINPVWVSRVNAFGFILLLLLMVLVTYSDIGKLL